MNDRSGILDRNSFTLSDGPSVTVGDESTFAFSDVFFVGGGSSTIVSRTPEAGPVDGGGALLADASSDSAGLLDTTPGRYSSEDDCDKPCRPTSGRIPPTGYLKCAKGPPPDPETISREVALGNILSSLNNSSSSVVESTATPSPLDDFTSMEDYVEEGRKEKKTEDDE